MFTGCTGQHVEVVGDEAGVPRDVGEEHAGVGAPGEQPHQHQRQARLPQLLLHLQPLLPRLHVEFFIRTFHHVRVILR